MSKDDKQEPFYLSMNSFRKNGASNSTRALRFTLRVNTLKRDKSSIMTDINK